MLLTIKYLGHASFLIASYDGLKIITDPYSDILGYTMPENIKADIVLISQNHPAHNCQEAVSGEPSVIQGEGVRELGWVKIKGIKSEKNTIFCWDMRAVKFCHLGALKKVPSKEVFEKIGNVDFLFLPVGGGSVLDLLETEKIIQSISPKYLIPMLYKTEYYQGDYQYTLEEFIAGRNNTIITKPKNIFELERDNLGIKQTQIIRMEYQE
jgi:L-ascorbate metabolism protein UlaG (beta-lactamase superfamily)